MPESSGDVAIALSRARIAEETRTNLLVADTQRRLYIEAEEAVPANTKRSYQAVHKRFLAYCRKNFSTYNDCDKVSGTKLLAYLYERQEKGKPVWVVENGKKILQNVPYAHQTLEGEVSAVVNLYKMQVARDKDRYGANASWDHPRDDNVKKFLHLVKLKTNDHNRRTFNKDADISGTYDGGDDLDMMITWAVGNTNSSRSFLGSIAALALSQSLLYRGDSIRNLDLSDVRYDCSYKSIVNEARIFPDGQPAQSNSELLIFIMRSSKTIKDNSRSTTASLRHEDVLRCSHWWLACYIIERFHVSQEDDILFEERKDFFNLKLFANPKHQDEGQRDKAFGYKYHYNKLKEIMRTVGIVGDKVTHAPRASGAQLCDRAGVVTDDIERFGMWRTGQHSASLLSSYIYNIPTRPVVALAGGDLNRAGSDNKSFRYHMERDLVKPSMELKNMLLPFLHSELLDKAYCARGNGDVAPLDEENKYLINTRTMAHYVALFLDHLRTVILQDYKFFMDKCPGAAAHVPVFGLPVFKSKEYAEFRAEQDLFYDGYHARLNDPTEAWKNDSSLIAVLERMHSQMQADRAETGAGLQQLRDEMQEMRGQLQVLTDGVQRLTDAILHGGHHIASSMLPPSPAVPAVPTIPVAPAAVPGSQGPPPTFNFILSPCSLERIWREYKYPLRGNPSIEQLNARYKTKWRSDAKIAKTYSRRKVIHESVIKGLAKGYTEQQCLDMLETARSQRNLTITAFLVQKPVPAELM